METQRHGAELGELNFFLSLLSFLRVFVALWPFVFYLFKAAISSLLVTDGAQ